MEVDITSEDMLKHITSVRVVIEKLKFQCRECPLEFEYNRDYQLHLATHITVLPKIDVDRFTKRHECKECGEKFVQISTLEAHAAAHEPFSHVCHCGIGFYVAQDLRSHKSLVHLAEMNLELPKLNFRQQRELKNEAWIPKINYTGPKYETDSSYEPERVIKPKLKAEIKIKSETKIHGKRDYGGPYFCKLCGKPYTQRGSLKLHLKRHAGIFDFACGYCGKKLITKAALQLHERTHTGLRPLSCKFCAKPFADPSALKRHHRTHTGIKPYACKFCGMRFSDASGKIAHEKRHVKDKKFECSICQTKFYSNSDVKQHMVSVHSDESKFECDYCHKSFKLKYYLCTHIKSLHENKRRYECDHCGKKFNLKHYLINHIFCQHSNSEKKYKCSECNGAFLLKSTLKIHMENVHTKSKEYICDLCGSRRFSKSFLAKHMLIHSKVKCDRCSKAFYQKRDLIKHKSKPCVKCKVCQERFTSLNSLKEHSVVQHAKSRDDIVDCQYCTKQYYSVKSLNRHYKNNHVTKKSYECNDCGMKFERRGKIINHIFSEHLYYLLCNICMRKFYSFVDLKKHKAIGCLPSKKICEICNKEMDPSSYKSHLDAHGGVMTCECDYCGNKYTRKCQLKRHIKLIHSINGTKRKSINQRNRC